MMQNSELVDLMKALGLKPGAKYRRGKGEEGRGEKLRYGRLMLMTDQDDDGSHIKGEALCTKVEMSPGDKSSDLR